jgi:energy-coupling factor transporter ATP-binding protein EcfA2
LKECCVVSRRRRKGIDFVDDTIAEKKGDALKRPSEEKEDGPALIKDTKDVDFSFLESIDEGTEASEDNQPPDSEIIKEKPNILDNSVVKNSGIEDVNFNSNFLRDADIEGRTGNYILSIGLPGSGKTTLQSFVTYYLMNKGPFTVSYANRETDSGAVDYHSQVIVDDWVDSWKKGRFPKANAVGDDQIREIRLNAQYLRDKSVEFNFSFLELSGEVFRSVVPTNDRVPNLADTISRFLGAKKINLTLVLFLDPNTEKNDQLFHNFFEFVKNSLGITFSKDVNLLFVVPNPQFVQKCLNNDPRYDRAKKFNWEDKKRFFVENNCPITYRRWLNWDKGRRGLMEFHIGTITNISASEVLSKPSYKDCERFIGWNYNKFTGGELRTSRIKRFLEWLKEE